MCNCVCVYQQIFPFNKMLLVSQMLEGCGKGLPCGPVAVTLLPVQEIRVPYLTGN